MSSMGVMRLTTPLLPWRPAILSPSAILRFWATETRTIMFTSVGQLVVGGALEDAHVDDLAALAVRDAQRGVLHLARLLAEDRAQQLLLRGELGLALRRDLAHQDVAFADLRADADDAAIGSRSRSDSSPTLGISRVISSGPSFVSRASTSYFSMWIEVNLSSRMMLSESTIASSKFSPSHDMKATSTDWPSASSPFSVSTRSRPAAGPAVTRSPLRDERALADARALVGAHELAERVALLAAGLS